MFKVAILLAFSAALLLSPAVAKPQVLVDYGYFPGYVYGYNAPLAYSNPYAYAYSYPYVYY